MRKPTFHRRLAHRLGYDIEKFNKQVLVETHLREMLPRWQIDTVLDVGANEGQFATMLRNIGYTGRIISFEPSQAAFNRLHQAASADPHWQTVHSALGETTGTVELHISGSSVFNSIHDSSTAGIEKFGDSLASSTTESVAIQRLDTFVQETLPDFASRRVFLKMDTQGHDIHVFDSAGDLRPQFAALQSEISVVPIYEGIPDYMQTLAHYRESDYEVTGLFTVNRFRDTGHVIEFDCVMAPKRV